METSCLAMKDLLAQWQLIAVIWDLGQSGVRHVPASRALGGLECRHPVNVSHYIPFYILFCIGHFSLLLELILFFLNWRSLS